MGSSPRGHTFLMSQVHYNQVDCEYLSKPSLKRNAAFSAAGGSRGGKKVELESDSSFLTIGDEDYLREHENLMTLYIPEAEETNCILPLPTIPVPSSFLS